MVSASAWAGRGEEMGVSLIEGEGVEDVLPGTARGVPGEGVRVRS
jgi:hypothetical protein